MTIEMGQLVQDTITGFKGIAIAKCTYLNGCVQWQVKSKQLQQGKTIEAEWFDEGRLTGVDDKPGGPQEHPPEMHP